MRHAPVAGRRTLGGLHATTVRPGHSQWKAASNATTAQEGRCPGLGRFNASTAVLGRTRWTEAHRVILAKRGSTQMRLRMRVKAVQPVRKGHQVTPSALIVRTASSQTLEAPGVIHAQLVSTTFQTRLPVRLVQQVGIPLVQ